MIPAQREFGSDIPAGDGNVANLFYGVMLNNCQRLDPPNFLLPTTYKKLTYRHYLLKWSRWIPS